MTIQDQLKDAYINKNWDEVAEVLKVFGVQVDIPQVEEPEVQLETPKKKGRPKKTSTKSTKAKQPQKEIDHQQWHNEHLGASVVIKNRPNKFDPDNFKENKKYKVPNDPKRFGEFAGKVFSSEEDYLKAAVYGPVKRHNPPPAKKCTIQCSLCNQKYKVFESELALMGEETSYKCDSCIGGRRKVTVVDED